MFYFVGFHSSFHLSDQRLSLRGLWTQSELTRLFCTCLGRCTPLLSWKGKQKTNVQIDRFLFYMFSRITAVELLISSFFSGISLLFSFMPQAALEEIHRFSGCYTCMNTFKGRTWTLPAHNVKTTSTALRWMRVWTRTHPCRRPHFNMRHFGNMPGGICK